MGILSTLFGHRSNGGNQLAELCFSVRNSNDFLEDYVSNCRETEEALTRLKFSREIIMIFIGCECVEHLVQNEHMALQIRDSFRLKYLNLVSPPKRSMIKDCLILENELKSVVERVDPGTHTQNFLGASMLTFELMMVVSDIRTPQFRRDFFEGSMLTTQNPAAGLMLWFPAAKRFLAQIRGVPVESISFNDANRLCISIHMPFTTIFQHAHVIFQ